MGTLTLTPRIPGLVDVKGKKQHVIYIGLWLQTSILVTSRLKHAMADVACNGGHVVLGIILYNLSHSSIFDIFDTF